MASIKVLKNGIVHSFGLHTDASVTNGNYIYVNINGTTHYARIGDDNTPLKVKKDGRTYSVQYEPVDFKRYHWERTANNIEPYSVILFFPKGRYRVILDGYNYKTYEFSTGSSENRTISLTVTRRDRFTCTISGLFAEYVTAGNVWNKLTIERIGD